MITDTTRQTGTEATRRRILATATRLFAARGSQAVTTQAIAEEVGVTKATLARHFASRDALRQAVLESILGHWRERLAGLVLAGAASQAGFERMFEEIYRLIASEPDRARFLAREALDHPDEAREALSAALQAADLVAGFLRTGPSGHLVRSDVDLPAFVVHLLKIVIGAVALSDVLSPALGAGDTGRERYERELARVVGASLYSQSRAES